MVFIGSVFIFVLQAMMSLSFSIEWATFTVSWKKTSNSCSTMVQNTTVDSTSTPVCAGVDRSKETKNFFFRAMTFYTSIFECGYKLFQKYALLFIFQHLMGPDRIKNNTWTPSRIQTDGRGNKTSLTLMLLMWRIGWAPNSIPIYSYIQQDATLNILFISGNSSTYFGWYFHPSSGAHRTVSTESGICHTVTAICRYRRRVATGLSVLRVAYFTHSTLQPVLTLSR
jgi:hypothetical protein